MNMGFPAQTTEGQTIEVTTSRIDGVKYYIDALGNKYLPTTEPLKLELVEAAQAVEAGVESVGDELKEAVAEVGAELGEAQSELAAALGEAATNVQNEVEDVVEAAVDLVQETVENVAEDITEVFGGDDEEPSGPPLVSDLPVKPDNWSPPANEGGFDGIAPAQEA